MADDATEQDSQGPNGNGGLSFDQIKYLIERTQAVPQPKAAGQKSPFQGAQQPPQSIPANQPQPGKVLDPASGAYIRPDTAASLAKFRDAGASTLGQMTSGRSMQPGQAQPTPPTTMSVKDAWDSLTKQNPSATTQQKWATIAAMGKSGMFKPKAAGDSKMTGIEGALYQDAIKKGMDPVAAAEVAAKYKRAGSAEAAATEMAKKRADLDIKVQAAGPKAKQTMERMSTNADDMSSAIKIIKKQSSGWTTGVAGAMFKALPGTDAYNLHANLERLTSRLGLDTLQEIKDSSPNGSALGRVTNYEMGLLVKAKENLDQAQSKEQFDAALDDLTVKIANSKKHIQSAYEDTYGNGAQAPAAADTGAKEAVDYTEYFK